MPELSRQDVQAVLDALGVDVQPAAGQRLIADQFVEDEGLGVTLEEGPVARRGARAAGRLVMRLALVPDAGAGDLESATSQYRAAYQDYQAHQASPGGPAADRYAGHAAVTLQRLPGREGPMSVTFVEAHGRIYRLLRPDDGGRTTRAAGERLAFRPRIGSPDALNLPSAASALRRTDTAAHVRGEKGPRPDLTPETAAAPARRHRARTRAAAGCIDWPEWKQPRLQTPWSSTANGDGFAVAGPSYYGQGKHLTCNAGGQSNDFEALDFAFDGPAEILPNAPGQVLYADWAKEGWRSYGRIVVIDIGDGFWTLAAHLSSIHVQAGDQVGWDTVIGLAGGSGDGHEDRWDVHLHNAIYQGAQIVSQFGGVHSGVSVEPMFVRSFRPPGEVYSRIARGQRLSW